MEHEEKQKGSFKWFILVLACLTALGDYYCFDNPGALSTSLKEHFKDLKKGDEYEYFYSLLYSVYSFPNMIVPLFGGILIYHFGNRKMYIAFSILIVIGQFLFALGCSNRNPTLMLFGRVVFGLGGESLNTTQSALIISWFPINQLALVLGICLSFDRFASVINDIISPRIATMSDVSSAIWVGFGICSFSLICTCYLIYLDWREDIMLSMKEIVATPNSSIRRNDNAKSDQENNESFIANLRSLPKVINHNLAILSNLSLLDDHVRHISPF